MIEFLNGKNFNLVGAKNNDDFFTGLTYNSVFEYALKNNKTVFKSSFSGNVSKPYEFYKENLINLGGKVLHHIFFESGSTCIWAWDDGAIELEFTYNDKYASLTINMTDEDRAVKIEKLFSDNKVEEEQSGHVFTIVQYGSSYQFQSIGFAGTKLQKDNYASTTIDSYNYVVNDLNSKNPSGRIAIFDGEPGTGKTFLVRSLLLDVPKACFVLVPPTMISALGSPELVPMLIRHKQSYSDTSGPIIFILEDADNCLAPRASDNMHAISAILNTGDGIFGDMFDIRIVATTNAKQEDFDPAIMRPGRLSKRINVSRLSYNEANSVFNRLVPGKNMPETIEQEVSMRPRKSVPTYSLAEIYQIAREFGWGPNKAENEDK